MAAAVSAEPSARVCCWRWCGIPGRPVPKPPFPTGDWVFKDVFARWTIG